MEKDCTLNWNLLFLPWIPVRTLLSFHYSYSISDNQISLFVHCYLLPAFHLNPVVQPSGLLHISELSSCQSLTLCVNSLQQKFN